VWYKISLFDTGGRTVEVSAYGMDHIMAPLEAVDSKWMRAVFPEVPTRGLEAACGRVDLLIGQDNCRLFPEELRRVENAALHRSRFGTGWITSGRPPGQGDPATSAETTTSAEEATSAGAATSAEEATSAGAATGAGEATSAGAATGAEEATSKEEAVNKGEPAYIAAMDKPAKPPDRLDEQYSSRSRRSQQNWRSRKSQETWRSRKSQETWRSWKSTGSWKRIWSGMRGRPAKTTGRCLFARTSHAAVVQRTLSTSPQARPPARTCACIGVPAERKTGQQARVASLGEQLASLLAQPQVRWLSTVPAEARVEPPEAQQAATGTLAPTEAHREPTEAQLAATKAQLAAAMSLAPAETPKQPQECSQRTPQPQHLRDQPKGQSVRQQQKLEEPSPPNMDWPRSQGEEDAMHNSRRAQPQDETAAEVRPTPPTNAVRGRRRTGQAAEVAEALIPSPNG
jgi:hypothetical protein